MGKAIRWLKALFSGIGAEKKKKKKNDDFNHNNNNSRSDAGREEQKNTNILQVGKRETIVSEITFPSTIVGKISRLASNSSGTALWRRRENYAAITIQSIFRGYLVSYYYSSLLSNSSSLLICDLINCCRREKH